MIELVNLDLLTVGIALALNLILGFIVFLRDVKSITNKLFLLFTFVTVGWSIFNYLNYNVTNELHVLWYIRLVMFFAVLQAFSFLLLMYVFPKDQVTFPKWLKQYLTPLVTLVAALTFTPLIFSGIKSAQFAGDVAQPIPGPAIPIFGLLAISCVVSGIVILLKKRIGSTRQERLQFSYLLGGVIFMFLLIITFNFILPTVYSNTRFIPLSAIFTLPFSIMVSYAVIRHHFMNVKVVSTAVLTFILSIVSFVEIIISDSLSLIIFRVGIFLLVLVFGVYLIRSVLKEVEQREQLQVLTNQLANANEQLKVLDKARADFISIASHQLRTPPATIKWYLSSIIGGDFGELPAPVKEQLIKTQVTNNSLIALIDDLLNASRIERGKLEFIFAPTDFLAITQLTVDQLTPQAEIKKLKIVFNKPTETLPPITADKEKIRQVMNNMIDNAIKYTKEGTVTVILEKTETDLLFKVKDTGKGVAKDQIEHVFGKYERGKTAASNATGLGLGMYVAKVIVEQHQGKIWLESEGEGKGSTFIFSVPLKSTLQNTTFDLTKDQKTS